MHVTFPCLPAVCSPTAQPLPAWRSKNPQAFYPMAPMSDSVGLRAPCPSSVIDWPQAPCLQTSPKCPQIPQNQHMSTCNHHFSSPRLLLPPLVSIRGGHPWLPVTLSFHLFPLCTLSSRHPVPQDLTGQSSALLPPQPLPH